MHSPQYQIVFALEQLLDCIVVLGLDGIDDLARVVVVELGGASTQTLTSQAKTGHR